jgi:hypothetical protein
MLVALYATDEVCWLTWKNAVFETPPPGAGLLTVTIAVVAVAMSAAEMAAVS